MRIVFSYHVPLQVWSSLLDMEHRFSRRKALRAAFGAITGVGLCACNRVAPADPISSNPQSTCCSTPQLESESLTITESNLIVDLSRALSLGDVGNAANIDLDEPAVHIIVVRTGAEKFYALSNRCTHAGRPISYIRSRDLLQCNNYNHSTFELTGQVFKGPAESPLMSYPLTLMDGKLEISLQV